MVQINLYLALFSIHKLYFPQFQDSVYSLSALREISSKPFHLFHPIPMVLNILKHTILKLLLASENLLTLNVQMNSKPVHFFGKQLPMKFLFQGGT